MLVEKVYRPGALTCRATDPIAVAARKMVDGNVGALAVLDGNMVVGIISERDVVRAVDEGTDLSTTTATTFASHQLRMARLSEDTVDVARRMLDAGIRPSSRGGGQHSRRGPLDARSARDRDPALTDALPDHVGIVP